MIGGGHSAYAPRVGILDGGLPLRVLPAGHSPVVRIIFAMAPEMMQ